MTLDLEQWRSRCNGVEPLPSLKTGGGLLDAEPLSELVRKDAETAYQNGAYGADNNRFRGLGTLAKRVGIHERRLYGLASGTAKQVTLDVADKYLCATGRHLRDLWPFLYTVEQAAADVYAIEHHREIQLEKDRINSRAYYARLRERQGAA